MIFILALSHFIGAVCVLGGLAHGRLCLAAKQGRESLHNRAVSDTLSTPQWPVGQMPAKLGCVGSLSTLKLLAAAQQEPFLLWGFLDGSGTHLEGQLGPSPRPPAFSSQWSCFPAHSCLALQHLFHEPAHHWDDLMVRFFPSCFPGTADTSLHPAATVAVSCAPHHANLPLD